MVWGWSWLIKGQVMVPEESYEQNTVTLTSLLKGSFTAPPEFLFYRKRKKGSLRLGGRMFIATIPRKVGIKFDY